MPPLDAVVAVEWWSEFEEDGRPKLDTLHDFHDAKRIVDRDLPEAEDSEVVTVTGTPANSDDALEEDAGDLHHVFLTHREALSHGIGLCASRFPRYTADHYIERERGDDGLLTEPGAGGVVFKPSTRHGLESNWAVDSFHDSYTSMLYRACTVRKHTGSAGGRSHVSYMPVWRYDHASFKQAIAVESSMTHVSKPRSAQSDELPAVRDRFGDDAFRTQVIHEHRVVDTVDVRPPILYKSESPPCGYERNSPLWGREEDGKTWEVFKDIRPMVADVIEQGNMVWFCEMCFPELAS